MNLNILLQRGYSKEQADEVVNWVSDNQKHFDELLSVFLTHQDYRIVQRAAWPLSYAAINQPQLIKKHYKKIIKQLNAPGQPAAVRRNILRIFDQLPEIPEDYHGVLMDSCFQYIADPDETIAAQAYALGILEKLTKLYPEILFELKTIVEVRMPNAAPAFRSRAKKILKKKS
ncbi:hypothetical protein U0035_05190 [Niabella yanshanensis]|uniref:HEAT repeat domain-containing protein n=1 Tax=Niabella yanshanensis TaxID=577386 RepID=A0ABZ0WAL6_9BACT|nr:hypothetical protein [Niabella yanshanensis]WQD39539.1 hypothetical protein U0035_05190 [Niabella yanshanensis]